MQPTLNRRDFMVAGGLAGGFLLSGMASASGTGNRRPPNIVLIVSDDQGWPDFGFMGHEVIRTPRLDRLARDSAVFPNGYVPCSLCRASLATILTGLYANQHHICCNDPPRGTERSRMHPFMRMAPAMPRLLRPSNFSSLQTGKFWEGHFSNAGFTHGQTTNTDRHISRQNPSIGRTGMQPIINFIDQNRENPFFVWYAPLMPHKPHNPPERFLRTYRNNDRDINIAKYFAMCEWFDETCGQLLDHLDRRQLTDNTMVLFIVDNGWVQGTAANPQHLRSPFGAPRGKRSPYDGGVRTPVLVKWPGHTRAGRYNDLVSSIDLAPTVLTACGVDVPEQMHGVDLMRAASGMGRLNRNAVFGEIYTHDCSVLGQPQMDVRFRWCRSGDWKLILPTEGNPELYNIARDPHERMNRAGQEGNRVTQLRNLINEWWNIG